MKEELNTKLAAAQRLLVELTEGDFEEHAALTDEFMSHVFELGRSIEITPELAQIDPARSFLDEARARIIRLVFVLNLFVTRTVYMLASHWEDDEWRYVCERRSSLEFLQALLSLPDMDELIDTAEVDKMMRSRGRDEGSAPAPSVPLGIPATHWWWYPMDPPGGEMDQSH